MAEHSGESSFTRFMNDYGMIFVLLLICIAFSATTIDWQDPQGAAAGRQVANAILKNHGAEVRVMVVAGDKGTDPEFTAKATEILQEAGATVLITINGSTKDTNRAIKKILAEGGAIDAIAATGAVARWSLFDNIPGVSGEKVIAPQRYRWPDFLTLGNFRTVANQTAIYAIIAIGMTMVIVTAGIDLSVGSLIALSSVAAALVIRDFGGGADAGVGFMVFGMTLGVLLCALAGLFNGVMITAFRLPSFIVTLAMMMMASGLAFKLASGESIPQLPASLRWLGAEDTAGVPNAVWLMAILYMVSHIVMTRTVFGRYIYAIGGNEEAARLSGVPVKRVQLAVYTICGALAGLGGIVLTSKLAAGDPKFGKEYELQVIAAVVVGGTSLMGGRGKIFGTLIGAFIIAVISNGMNLTGIGSFDQKIVLGAVLLVAVLIDTLKNRGGGK